MGLNTATSGSPAVPGKAKAPASARTDSGTSCSCVAMLLAGLDSSGFGMGGAAFQGRRHLGGWLQLAAYEHVDSAQTTQDTSRLAGLQKKASDARVAYPQGSPVLAEAPAIALLSTMVPDHGDTNQMALDLTDRERLLLARGDSLFGAALTDEHESGPIVAAQMLIAGLNKQRGGR